MNFQKNTQHYTSLQNTQLHKTLQSHTKHYKQTQIQNFAKTQNCTQNFENLLCFTNLYKHFTTQFQTQKKEEATNAQHCTTLHPTLQHFAQFYTTPHNSTTLYAT